MPPDTYVKAITFKEHDNNYRVSPNKSKSVAQIGVASVQFHLSDGT